MTLISCIHLSAGLKRDPSHRLWIEIYLNFCSGFVFSSVGMSAFLSCLIALEGADVKTLSHCWRIFCKLNRWLHGNAVETEVVRAFILRYNLIKSIYCTLRDKGEDKAAHSLCFVLSVWSSDMWPGFSHLIPISESDTVNISSADIQFINLLKRPLQPCLILCE